MGPMTRWLRSLWRTLGNSRLGAILLAALLLACLLASLFPQMPTDPAARGPWLEAIVLRYRHATGLLRALGLFDTFHAPWFLALLAALLLNTLACTAQRLPHIWRLFTKLPAVVRPDAFYQASAHRVEWPLSSVQEGLATIQETLAQRHYAIYVKNNEPAHCASVYAERGRWAQVGTLVGHVAAFLLLIVIAARPALGWQETNVRLLPDQSHTIGHKHEFAVRPGLLTLERHPGGQPRDYRLPLTVLQDDSPVLTQTVRINHPLTFRGVTFHLQGYGPAARLTAPEGTFDLTFAAVQAQEVTLPKAGLTLRVAYRPEEGTLYVEALAANGELLGSGTVIDGQEIEVQGTPVTFSRLSYTVWQVSHDPTFGPAVGLTGLMLLATLVSLWVSHQRVWLRLDGQKAQMVTSVVGGELDGEFDSLASELTQACRAEGETGG